MALSGSYTDAFGNVNENAYCVVDSNIEDKKNNSVAVQVKIYKDKSARDSEARCLYKQRFIFDGEDATNYFVAEPTEATRKDDIFKGAYALIKTLTDVPFEGWTDA